MFNRENDYLLLVAIHSDSVCCLESPITFACCKDIHLQCHILQNRVSIILQDVHFSRRLGLLSLSSLLNVLNPLVFLMFSGHTDRFTED